MFKWHSNFKHDMLVVVSGFWAPYPPSFNFLVLQLYCIRMNTHKILLSNINMTCSDTDIFLAKRTENEIKIWRQGHIQI